MCRAARGTSGVTAGMATLAVMRRVRADGERHERRTAHRWVAVIAKRAGLGSVYPHMLSSEFIMAALDAGVPLRDVQIAARHADPRSTTSYARRRAHIDRHATYVVFHYVCA